MSDGPVIVTRGLHKTYRTGFWMRPHVGLHPLDLRVAGGSVFGFVGPNGAGKTTTIKILVGIHEASGGEATVLGLDHRDPEARRLGHDLLQLPARDARPARVAHAPRRAEKSGSCPSGPTSTRT